MIPVWRRQTLLATTALGAALISPGLAQAEDTVAEIRALKAELKATIDEVRTLKSELHRYENKSAQQDRKIQEAAKETKAEAAKATNVANAAQVAAAGVKGPLIAPGIKPVVVSFTNGLTVETVDKEWYFKIGGRLQVDGGASSQPFNGRAGNAGIRRARIALEGRAAKVWFYKLEYDFASNAPYTSSFAPIGIAGCVVAVGGAVNCGGGNITSLPKNTMIGGLRDAYFGTDSPLLTTPLSKDPAWIMFGNQWEPNGLEQMTSDNFSDFVEKSIVTDTFTAARHIGVSAGLHGDVWSWKGGVYSTAPEDKALAPPASSGAPLIWAVGTSTTAGPLAITRNYAGTGGGQYFDISTRATVAPLFDKEEQRLIHFGGWFRYHRPNDATAANDDRNMTPGSTANWNGAAASEANILSEQLLGGPDLSCGFVPLNYAQTIVRGVYGGPLVSGRCVKDEQVFGLEAEGTYGPFSVQGEYMHSHYNRDAYRLLYAATALSVVTPASVTAPANGVYVPGGTSVDFSGFYVYTTYYLTGESRSQSYNVASKDGANFDQIKILHPFSEGGMGAWEIGARLSSVNLNSGPISGQSYVNAMNAAALAGSIPGASPNNANIVRAVANAGIVGGRQNDFTLGVNWYPDKGIRFMANWVRVVNLSAPFDRPWEQGAHPNLFVMRAQVNW
jgi:phosphate-selective porin OprO and OprP